MAKDKMNIPQIRFKGFNEAWLPVKLKDITSLITKGTTPLDKSWSGTVNYIKTDSIDSSSGNLLITEFTSLEEHNGHLKRSQLRKDDILFSIVGTLGRVGLVKDINLPANTNQQIAIIRLKKDNPKFIFNSLKTEAIKSFIHSDSTIGAQPSLSLWQINDILLKIPLLEEQIQIGDFFQKIDQVIELQQKALDTARAYKQSMLQKMFPQKGEKVPRVRFAGFSGDWEDYALHKITNRLDNLRKPVTASERILGTTPYYGANGIQDYVQGYTHEGEHILVAEDGANNLRDYPIQYVKGKIWVNNHAHVLAAKASCDIKFLSYALKKINFIPFLVGGGRAKLNAHIMMQIKVRIPKIEEQTQIGNFFEILDQQIEQQAQKLATYQQLKKAMLQRMFV